MFRLQFKILRKTHLLTPDVFQRYKISPSCSLKRHLYNHLRVPMSRKLSKLLNIFNKQNQKWSTFNYYNNTNFKHLTNVNFSKTDVHKISKFKNCKSKKSVALLKKNTKAISSKKCFIKKCGARSSKNSKECSCSNILPKDSLLIKIELPKEEYNIAKPFCNAACLTKVRSYNTLCAKYSKLQHILSKISRNNYKLRHCSNKYKDDDRLFRSKGRTKKSSLNKLKTYEKGTNKVYNLKSEGNCLINNAIKKNKKNLHELPNHHSLRVAKMKKNNITGNTDKRNRKKIINIIIEISGTDNDYPKQLQNSTKKTINILNEVDPEVVRNENVHEDKKFAFKKQENNLPIASKQKIEETYVLLDPTNKTTGENKNSVSIYVENESRNQKIYANKELAAVSKKNENLLPSDYKTKNAFDSKYSLKENYSKKSTNLTLESDGKINKSNLDAESKQFKKYTNDKKLLETGKFEHGDDQTKVNKKCNKDIAALATKTECINQITENLLENFHLNVLDFSKTQAVHNHRKLAPINVKTDLETDTKRFKNVSSTCDNVTEIYSKNLDIKNEPNNQKEVLNFSSSNNVEINTLEPFKKTQENNVRLNLKNKTDHKKWLKFLQQKNKNFRCANHDKNENNFKRDSELHWISFKSEFNKTEHNKPTYALSDSYNKNNITQSQLKSEPSKNKVNSFPCFETKANSLEKNNFKCNSIETEVINNSDLNKNGDKQYNITENDLQHENENTNYNSCECSLHDAKNNIEKSVTCEFTSPSYPELKQESLQKKSKDNLYSDLKSKNQNKYQSSISSAKNINQGEFVAKKNEIENDNVIKRPKSYGASNYTEINAKNSLKSELFETANKIENQKCSTKDKPDSVQNVCNVLSTCYFKKESENKSKQNATKYEPIKNEITNSPVSAYKNNYKSNITEYKADLMSKSEPKNLIIKSENVLDSMQNTSNIDTSSCFKTEMNNQNKNNWNKFEWKPNETQNTNIVEVKNIVANESLFTSNRQQTTNKTENQNISKQNTIQSKIIENSTPSNDLNSTHNYKNLARNELESVPIKSNNAPFIKNENSIQKNVSCNPPGFTTEAEIKKTDVFSSFTATESKNQIFNTDCTNPPCCSNKIQNKENKNELEFREINNQNANITKPEEIQIQKNCVNADSAKSLNPTKIDNNQKNITKTTNKFNNISFNSGIETECQNINPETKKLNQNIIELQSKTTKTENALPLALQKQIYQMKNITKIKVQSESNKCNVTNDIKTENSNKLNITEINNTKNITSSDIQNKIKDVSKKDSDSVPNISLNSKKDEQQIKNVSNVIECKPEDVQNNNTNNEFEFASNNKAMEFKNYIKNILLKKVKPDHRVYKVRPYVKQQYCYEEITPQYLQKKSLDQRDTNAQINHEKVSSSDCNEQLDSIKCKNIKTDKQELIENKPNISNVIPNQIPEIANKKLSSELKQLTREYKEKTNKQLNNEIQLENELNIKKNDEKSVITNNINNQELAPNSNFKQLTKKFEKEAESKLTNKSKTPETNLKEVKFEAVNKFEFKNESCQSHIDGNKSLFEPTKNKEMLGLNNNETGSSELNQNVIANLSQKGKNIQENYETKIATGMMINNEKQGTKTEDQSDFKCKKATTTNKLSTDAGSVIGFEIKNSNKIEQNYSNNYPSEYKTESSNPNKKITDLQSSKSTVEILQSKQDKTNSEHVTTQLCLQNASPTNYANNNTTNTTLNNKKLTEVEAFPKDSNIFATESQNQTNENKKALLSALVKFNHLLSKAVTKAIEMDGGSINITAELYSQLKMLKSVLKIEIDKGKRNYGIQYHDANQIEYETIKADLLNALIKFNKNKCDIALKQETNKKIEVNNKRGTDNILKMSKTKGVSFKIINNSKIKKTKRQLKKIKYIVTRKLNKIIGNKYKLKRRKFESDKNNNNKIKSSKISKCKRKISVNNLEFKKSRNVIKAIQFNQNINYKRANEINIPNYKNKIKLHTAPAYNSNFSSKGPNNNDEDITKEIENQKSHDKPEINKTKKDSSEEYINSLSLVNTAPDVYKVPDKQNKDTNNEQKISKRYNFFNTLKPNEKQKSRNKGNFLSKAKIQAYYSKKGSKNNFSNTFEQDNTKKNKYQYKSLKQKSTPLSELEIKAKNNISFKNLLNTSLSKKSIKAADNQTPNKLGGFQSKGDNNKNKPCPENEHKVFDKIQMVSDITPDKNKIEIIKAKDSINNTSIETKYKVFNQQLSNQKNDSITQNNKNVFYKITENQTKNKANAVKPEQEITIKLFPEPTVKVDNQVIDTKYKYIISSEPYYIKEVEVTNKMDKVKVLDNNEIKDNKLFQEAIILIDGHNDNLGTTNINGTNNKNQGKINIEDKKLVQDSKTKSTLETEVNPEFKIKPRKSEHNITDPNNSKKDQDKDKLETIKSGTDIFSSEVKLNNIDSYETIKSQNKNNLQDKNKKELTENQIMNKLDAVKSEQVSTNKSSPETNINSDHSFSISTKNKYPFTNVPFRIRAKEEIVKPVEGNKNLSSTESDLKSAHEDKNTTQIYSNPVDLFETTENNNKNKLETAKSERKNTGTYSPETNVIPDNQASNENTLKIETKNPEHDSKNKSILENKANLDNQFNNVSTEPESYNYINFSNTTKTNDDQNKIKATKSKLDDKSKYFLEIENQINNTYRKNAIQDQNKIKTKKSEHDINDKLKTDYQVDNEVIITKTMESQQDSKEKSIPGTETVHQAKKSDSTIQNPTDFNKSSKDHDKNKSETIKSVQYRLSKICNDVDLKNTKNQTENKLEANKTENQMNIPVNNDFAKQEDFYNKEAYRNTDIQDKNKIETVTSVKPTPETKIKTEYQLSNMKNDSYFNESYKTTENQNINKFDAVKSEQNTANKSSPSENIKNINPDYNVNTKYKYPYPKASFRNKENQYQNMEIVKPVEDNNNLPSPETYMKTFHEVRNTNAASQTLNYSYPIDSYQTKANYNKYKLEETNMYSPESNMKNDYHVNNYTTYPNEFNQATQNQNQNKLYTNKLEQEQKTTTPDTYNAIRDESKMNEYQYKFFNYSNTDSHLDEYDRPNYHFSFNEDYPDTDYNILEQKNLSKSTPQDYKNDSSVQNKSTTYNDVKGYDLSTYNNNNNAYANYYYSDNDRQKTYPKLVTISQQNSNVPVRAENNQYMNSQIKSKSDQVMYNTTLTNNTNTVDINQNINKEEIVTNNPYYNDSASFVIKFSTDENLDDYDRPTYNINNDIYKLKPNIIKVEKYQLEKDEKGNYNLEMKYEYINTVDNSIVNLHDYESKNVTEKQKKSVKQMQDSSLIDQEKKNLEENNECIDNFGSNNRLSGPSSLIDQEKKNLEENNEYIDNLVSNNRFRGPNAMPPVNPLINTEIINEEENIYKSNNALPIPNPNKKRIKISSQQENEMKYWNDANNMNNSFNSTTSIHDKLDTKDKPYLENLNKLRNETAKSIINSHKKPMTSTNDSSTTKKHLSGNTEGGSQNSDKKMLSPESGFGNSNTTRMLSQSSFYKQNLEMINKNNNKNNHLNFVIAANLLDAQFRDKNKNVLQNWPIDEKIKDIDKKISAPDKHIDIHNELNTETHKDNKFNFFTDVELRLKPADFTTKSEIELQHLELENKIDNVNPVSEVKSEQHIHKLPIKEKHSKVENKTKKTEVQEQKIMTVFRSANTEYVNYSKNNLKKVKYQYPSLENHKSNYIKPVCHSGPAPYRNKYCVNLNLWPNNENLNTELETKSQEETGAYNFPIEDPKNIRESNILENEFQSGHTVSADNSNFKNPFHSGPTFYINTMPSKAKQDSKNCSATIINQVDNSEPKFDLKTRDCAFEFDQNFELENRIDETKPIYTRDIIVDERPQYQNLSYVNHSENNMNSVSLEPLIEPLRIPHLQSEAEAVNQYVEFNDFNKNDNISCTYFQSEITTDPRNFESDLHFPTENDPMYVSENITINQISEDEDNGSKMKSNDFMCQPAAYQIFEQSPKKTRIRMPGPNQKVKKCFKQNNALMRMLMSKTLVKHASVPTVNMSMQYLNNKKELSESQLRKESIAQNNIEVKIVSSVPEWLEHSNDIFPSYIQENQNYPENKLSETEESSDINYRYSSNDSACHYADILQMFHPRCTKTVVKRRKPRFETLNTRYSPREYSNFLSGHLNAPLDNFHNNKVPNNSKHYFSSVSNRQVEATRIKNQTSPVSKISNIKNDDINPSIPGSNSLDKLLLSDQKCFASNDSNNAKFLDKIMSSYAEICSENTSTPNEPNDESNNVLGKLMISIAPNKKVNTKLSEDICFNKSHIVSAICNPEAKKDYNKLFEKTKKKSEEKQSEEGAKKSPKEIPNFLDNIIGKNETTCAKNILNSSNKYAADILNQSTTNENKLFKSDTSKTNIVATSLVNQDSSEKIAAKEKYPDKNQCILHLLTRTESKKETSSLNNALSHSKENLEKNILSSTKTNEHKSEAYKDKTMNVDFLKNLLPSCSKSLDESIAKITIEKTKPFKGETKSNILSPSNKPLEGSIAFLTAKTNKDKSEIRNNTLAPNNEHLKESVKYLSTKSKEKISDSLKDTSQEYFVATSLINQELANEIQKDASLRQYSQHKKSIVSFLHCLDNYRGLNSFNNILAQNSRHAARIICSPRKTMPNYKNNLVDKNTSKKLANAEKNSTNQSEQPKSNKFYSTRKNTNTKTTNVPQNIYIKKEPQLAIKIIIPSEKINSIVVKCSMDSLTKDKQNNIKTISKTDNINPIVSTTSVKKSNSITTTDKEALVSQVLLKNQDKIILPSVKSYGFDSRSVPKSIIAGNFSKGTSLKKDPYNLLSQNTSVKENKFGTLEKRSESDKNITNSNVNIKQDSNMKSTTIQQNANENDTLQKNKKDNYTNRIPKSVDRAKEKLETVNKVNLSIIPKQIDMAATSYSQQTNVKELSKQNDAKEYPKEEKICSPESKEKVKEILSEKVRNKKEIIKVQNLLKANKKEKHSLNNSIDLNYLTRVDDRKNYTTLDTFKKIKDQNGLLTVSDEQNVKFTSTPQDASVRELVTEEASSKKIKVNTNEYEKEEEADVLIKLFDKAIQAINSISVNNILNVRFQNVTTLSQENNVSKKKQENESIKHPLPENSKRFEIIMNQMKNAKDNPNVNSKNISYQCKEIDNKNNSIASKNIQPVHKKAQEKQSTTKPKSAEKSANRTVPKNKIFETKSLETIDLKAESKKDSPTSDKPQGKKIDSSVSKKLPLKKDEVTKDDKSTSKQIQIRNTTVLQEAMKKFEQEIVNTIIKNIPTKKDKPTSKPSTKCDSNSAQKIEKSIDSNNDNKRTLEDSIKEENVKKVLKLKGDFEILEKIFKSNSKAIPNNEPSLKSKKPQENNKVLFKSLKSKCTTQKNSLEKTKSKSKPKNEVLSFSNYKKSKPDSSSILNKKIEKTPKNAKNFKFTSSKCVIPEMTYGSVKIFHPSSTDKVGADVIRNSIVRAISKKNIIKSQKNLEIENSPDDSNILKRSKSYEHNHESALTKSDIILTPVISKGSLCKFPKTVKNYEDDENICNSDDNVQYDNTVQYDDSAQYDNTVQYDNSIQYDDFVQYGNTVQYDNSVHYDDSVCHVEQEECVVKLTKEDQEFIEFRRNSSQYNGFIKIAPSECVKDEHGTYVYISKFDHEKELNN